MPNRSQMGVRMAGVYLERVLVTRPHGWLGCGPIGRRRTRRGEAQVTQDAATRRPRQCRRRPRAAETAARRQRLLVAAVELAAEGGYDAVQMRDVAAAPRSRSARSTATTPRRTSCCSRRSRTRPATLRTRLAQRPPQGDQPGDRVADVLRARDARARPANRRVTAAMVTALVVDRARRRDREATRSTTSCARSSPARSTARDGRRPRRRSSRVLGYVWLATLSAWVGGMIDADGMAADLTTAAHLLARRLTTVAGARRVEVSAGAGGPLAEDRGVVGVGRVDGPDDEPVGAGVEVGAQRVGHPLGPADEHSGPTTNCSPLRLGFRVGRAEQDEPTPRRRERPGARARRSTSRRDLLRLASERLDAHAPAVPAVGAFGRDAGRRGAPARRPRPGTRGPRTARSVAPRAP